MGGHSNFQILQEQESDFTRFGERICNELEPLADQCEAYPPYLEQFDSWGNRVDKVGKLSGFEKMDWIISDSD